MNNLTVGSIISNGFSLGLKNVVALIVNTILWVLTIWIPYLNVGTTIGLFIGLVPKMSKGDTISMTEIFNPVYRKRMGDIFLVNVLITVGVEFGLLFLVIPGLVLSVSWILAAYLVLDKGLNAMDAIHKSNELTSGKKWSIFGGLFILHLLLAVALFIGLSIPYIGSLIVIAVYLVAIPITLGALAYIYGALVE